MSSFGTPIHEVRLAMKHLPLLQMQRGALSNLRHQPQEWASAYRQSLLTDYTHLKPYLPQPCKNFIDVGGGMSGLGILISRFYRWGRGGTNAYILDGTEHGDPDPDLEHDHDVPFNDAQLTFDYWQMNGLPAPTLISPDDVGTIDRELFFDLIVSTQSWCFHFEPDEYLEELTERSHARTWLMVDVRKGKPEWIKQLERHWTLDKVVHETPKFMRTLWHPHR